MSQRLEFTHSRANGKYFAKKNLNYASIMKILKKIFVYSNYFLFCKQKRLFLSKYLHI